MNSGVRAKVKTKIPNKKITSESLFIYREGMETEAIIVLSRFKLFPPIESQWTLVGHPPFASGDFFSNDGGTTNFRALTEQLSERDENGPL